MNSVHLENGNWTVEIAKTGHIIALGDGLRILSTPSHVICELSGGDPERLISVTSARLVHASASSAEFETTLDIGAPLTLRFAYAIHEADDHGTALTCRVMLRCDTPLLADVLLRWFWSLRPRHAGEGSLFVPLFDGRGLRTSLTTRTSWHFVCAGHWGNQSDARLALPAVVEEEGDLHLTHFADPFFSTGITLRADNSPACFECRFLKEAGRRQFAEREFGSYVHTGDEDTGLLGFFRYGLPTVPPGPAWLHDIAMVHYDYLSENGQGWFRDIDRLGDLIPPEERGCVALTLHGWYDLLGQYAYDRATGKLFRHWVAMPKGDSLEMSPAEIHRRIAYARVRGYRVLLYFADGMAIDSGAPGFHEDMVFKEPDGSLRTHHWAGPDTIARTYIMDPCHPHVQEFFHGYLEALLNEFGTALDGLTWDETFTTRAGDISRGGNAGYADRTFMLLCHDLRRKIKTRHPDCVLLASDCAGLRLPQDDGTWWSAAPAQNALVFDGTYQDSHCNPSAWQYGLFPNYRNVLWSCNWQPVKNIEWTALGVRTFGSPAAISNGWGESRGISKYSDLETKGILDLFREKRKRSDRVRWIESREE